MCTFLLSFITWEKSLSTRANVNRCLRSEESDSSFELLAFNDRPPWNRINKVFLFVCNQSRMPCCPSRSDELTDRYSTDFLSIVTYLSDEANRKNEQERKKINLLPWSEIDVMPVDASGNVLSRSFSFSIFPLHLLWLSNICSCDTHTVALNCNLVML